MSPPQSNFGVSGSDRQVDFTKMIDPHLPSKESNVISNGPPPRELRRHRRRLQRMVDAMNQRNAKLEEENRLLREALSGLSEISCHLRASNGTYHGSSAAMIAYRFSLYAILDRKLREEAHRQQLLQEEEEQEQQRPDKSASE